MKLFFIYLLSVLLGSNMYSKTSKKHKCKSGTNQTRCLDQHKLCECKCGVKEGVSDSNQKLNHNEI